MVCGAASLDRQRQATSYSSPAVTAGAPMTGGSAVGTTPVRLVQHIGACEGNDAATLLRAPLSASRRLDCRRYQKSDATSTMRAFVSRPVSDESTRPVRMTARTTG